MVVSLIKDVKFLEQIYDILEDEYFENESIKWIISECKDYYLKYKKCITFDIIKIKLNNVEDDLLKTSVIETLRDIYKHMEDTELEFVQDESLNFFKNQSLKNAIIKSVDILQSKGDFEQIKVLIDDAMKAGIEKNIGHEYIEHIDDRYSESARTTVASPWDVINDLTQGGLGPGELGVIVAPAGIGKTWFLSALGAGSLKNGKSIVHYSLELNEAYVGLRYDSIITGVSNQNLKYNIDEVKKKLSNLDGNLIIKYFPTKSASVQTLSSHLQRMKTLGHDIDMVVVDYADLLRDTNKFTKEVRHALGNIYEDLRGLAGEIEVPIWTASQANRSALEDDIIEAGKVAEAYSKIMTADFVMSVSRKVEDKIANTGRVHVIKNRFGPDGMTFPSSINLNNGKIEIYEATTNDGKQQQKKMDNGNEYVRKMLSNKYEDLMKDE
tara:strand:+ start:326 stop:1642 length:1317 start_codon:yes stop_codon:yes gene_type:complete